MAEGEEERNHCFSNMTATISNKMQWRFKSSVDLLGICRKLPVDQRDWWPRDLLTCKEMNGLISMGRTAITANCGTSLVSWQCGWEVSEHFGVCYKLSLIQDGVYWKWGFIRSFNMKTWWLTLINHLLDFMDWALSWDHFRRNLLLLLSKSKNPARIHAHNHQANLKMQKWANLLFAPKYLGCLCTKLSLILPIPFAPIFLVSLSLLLVFIFPLNIYYAPKQQQQQQKVNSQSEGLIM